MCVMFVDRYGCLPVGFHLMTWEDVLKNFSFSPRRNMLLMKMELILQILKKCGCEYLYIDGSFVTDKLEPGDIDAFFSIKEGADLDVIYGSMIKEEPLLMCTQNNRKLQKEKYGCELFYENWVAFCDENGNSVKYIDFFQQLRGFDGIKKGIVKIDIQAL
jgi:hypothetical protein